MVTLMITDKSRVVTPEMLKIAHRDMLHMFQVHQSLETNASLLIFEHARSHWYTFRALCSASGHSVL